MIVAPFARNVAIFGGPAGELTQAVVIEDPTRPASWATWCATVPTSSTSATARTGPVFSGAVLGALDWVYHDLLGQDLADLRTTVEIYQEPFEVQDYSIASVEDRCRSVAPDPVPVQHRHPGGGSRPPPLELRLPLALALAGVVGYVVFAGTIKTGTYGNRFYIPLWVVLAPVVAVAMSRLPRNLVRVVALPVGGGLPTAAARQLHPALPPPRS